jgi:hypothetical protein
MKNLKLISLFLLTLIIHPSIASAQDAKNVTVECEDLSVKPKATFLLNGTDTQGAVVAEAVKDGMLVRLSFDNSHPELGRKLEVIVNGETNTLSLQPGLKPISFKPGFVMKMMLKAIGMSNDIKISCAPLTQKVIPSEIQATPVPEKMVDDSERASQKDFPSSAPKPSDDGSAQQH